MLSKISVLVVIDTNGALVSGSAADNSYIVDTNGYLGSWQEGSTALHTIGQDGQIIEWSVSAVSPGGQASITGFSGTMLSSGSCVPTQEQEQVWTGQIESHGQFQSFSYTLSLSIAGQTMSLDAFLKVV